ncbi:DNA methyltransferase, partial [Escherichia coli]|uniref:DNA methyltransferase n=1 Tax=Escherichia coli TaxID=562 RepID=UPI002551426F
MEFIQTLPENSVDLIVTDPPYFKVKPEGWDNQWKGDDDYLKWLDQCLAQFWRVLKPAGSLYLFCGHRLALMNPLMILVKIIKLRWIHILSYDQMVSR